MIEAAEKVYDCLHRERYRYMLGSAVDDRLLAQYTDTSAFQVLVYDARHLLPQSRVTFQVRPRDGSFLINGALGLDYVTITYLRDTRLETTRAAQEAILARLNVTDPSDGTFAYLDNNATTAMSPAARKRMKELLAGPPGNPAALHGLGTAAQNALVEARACFVRHLGGAAQVLFTSGATEANGSRLLGVLRHPENRCEQLVVSELEHASVYDLAELPLERPVAVCRARPDGTPDLDHLQDLIAGRRTLVLMMHVSNETGWTFPVSKSRQSRIGTAECCTWMRRNRLAKCRSTRLSRTPTR